MATKTTKLQSKSRPKITPKEAVNQMVAKQEQLLNLPLGSNAREIQQSSKCHEKCERMFGTIKGKMKLPFTASKGRCFEFKEIDRLQKTTKNIAMEKQKCLELLLAVSKIEEYYQTLSAEVDTRTLDLCEQTCTVNNNDQDTPLLAGATNGHSESAAIAKVHNECIYAVRNVWDWLTKASWCMEVHLKNAAAYHQFQHEIKHCDTGLKAVATRLRQQSPAKDVNTLITQVRDLTREQLDFQVRVEALSRRATDIIPLPHRKSPIKQPLKATALVSYTEENVSIDESEELFVLDNSDAVRWKVRKLSDEECEVPALIVLVPGPDGALLESAQRLRHQLLYTSKLCFKLVQQHAQKYYITYLSKHKPDEIKPIDLKQRSSITNCLQEMLDLLTPLDGESDGLKELEDASKTWQTAISNMKQPTPDRHKTAHTVSLHWKTTNKLMKHMKELTDYVKTYDQDLSSTCETQHFLVQNDGSPIKYVSNAYIERIDNDDVPHGHSFTIQSDGTQVDNNMSLTSVNTSMSSDSMDAQHVMLAEKSPLRLVKPAGVNITIDEEWIVEKDLTYEEEEFSEQTSRETQTFVIIGVVDPQTQDTISIYRAINRGIINQTKGVYLNPATKEVIPIPEAMSQGLILVEYTNKHVENDDIKRGVITTRNVKETVSYSIRGVIDPISGETITVAEAVKLGVIDQATGRYINPVTGFTMSLADAIDEGLIDIQKVEKTPRDGSKPTTTINGMNGNTTVDGLTNGDSIVEKDYVVQSVLDPRTNKMVPLTEAIRAGLIDPKTGHYIDPRTGKKVPLNEAINQGLVNATEADPINDKHNNNKICAQIPHKEMTNKDYIVKSVLDPRTKKMLPLSDAIRAGLIDPDTGEYINPLTGRRCSLDEAIMKGLIHGTEADPVKDKYNKNKISAIVPADSTLEKKDYVVNSVLDPRTNKMLSLDDAVAAGLIDPNTGAYIDPITGERVSLVNAMNSGLIKAREANPSKDKHNQNKISVQVPKDKSEKEYVVKSVLDPRTNKMISLEDAIESGLIDPVTGDYVDPKTGKTYTMEDAIRLNLVLAREADQHKDKSNRNKIKVLRKNPEGVEKDYVVQSVFDPNTNRMISLDAAIKSGLIDPKTGEYIDPVTGERLSLDDAIKRGIVKATEADPLKDKFNKNKITAQLPMKDMIGKEFVVQSVLDPRTNEMLSFRDAIKAGLIDPDTGEYVNPITGKKYTMDEAIRKGLIKATEADPVNDKYNKNKIVAQIPAPEKKNKDYIVQSVLDPRTNKMISLDAAIRDGLIDPNTGEYIDPSTGQKYSMDDAIQKGLIQATEADPIKDKFNKNKISASIPVTDKEYVIDSVLDPRTNQMIHLIDAIHAGLIDPISGEYIDPITGEHMPLCDAIGKGLINGREADLFADQNNENKLSVKVPLIEAENVDGLYSSLNGEGKDINNSVFSKLKSELDLSTPGIVEEISGTNYTIGQAFDAGILSMDPVHVKNSNNDKYSLPEATVDNLVHPSAAREILSAIEPHGLDKLIEAEELDLDTGKVLDSKTNKPLSIAAALRSGQLDSDMVFYTDIPAQSITSLSSAIANKQLNPDSGKVVNPRSGEELTIADAINQQLIDPSVNAEKILDQVSAMRLLKSYMDTSSKGITNTRTAADTSVEDAVRTGILDVPHCSYVDLKEQSVSPIPDAVDADLIEADTAKKIYNAMGNSSLNEALQSHFIDPQSGKFIDPETGRPMSIKAAIESGLLDPKALFFVDPNTSQVTCLDSFIKEGKFNPVSGKFKDPLTGLETSIAKAIKNGVIQPDFCAEDFIEDRCSVQSLLDGPDAGKDLVFVSPSGHLMSLKEAIDAGLITPQTKVKLDTRTGQVSIADPSATNVIQAIIDSKDQLDWVADLERELVLQPKSMKPEIPEIDKCIHEDEILKKDLDKRRPSIEKLLDNTQEILAKNKDSLNDSGLLSQISPAKDSKFGGDKVNKDRLANGGLENNIFGGKASPDKTGVSAQGTGKPSNQQQYHRLRCNAADLKVRFDGANNEVDNRLQQLEEMKIDLEDFHQEVNDVDVWLDDADQLVKNIKQATASEEQPQKLIHGLQVVQDSALSREQNLTEAHRTADHYKQKAKNYAKDTSKYNDNLPTDVNPTRTKPHELEVEAANLDIELDRVNERLKSVTGDCDKLMDKLSETASKNQKYNELKDRLDHSLPKMKTRMEDCDYEPAKGSDGQKELSRLNSLTADVVAESKVVDDFTSVGEDLLHILGELDCGDTPKAKNIQHTMEDVQEKFDHIQEGVTEKQHQLTDAVVKNQDVGHNIDSLLEWINDTEATLDMAPPISVDLQALDQQISEHRVFASDIDAHKARVTSLADQCQENAPGSEVAENIEQLTDRFDILESRAEQRGAQMADIHSRLGRFHGDINQMKGWLSNTVRSLKRGSNDYDTGALKNKIENLYKQKNAKQSELEAIRAEGRALVDDPETSDKNKLRESLTDIQTKWHELNELLVQMIFFAALKDVDESLKYLDKAENEINTAEPISIDPETLAIQLRDHKAFDNDLENKRQSVNDTIEKCNRLLRETASDEADDYKNKLDTIRSQADLVSKMSTERLTQLEEALPLASHFSETHTDLQSWLGEIEAEVLSLEVHEEAGTEQIRKQQENAKTTKRIIDDHKPLVEDLQSSGYELAEICSDEDGSAVRSTVDGIAGKYEKVRQNVRDKVNSLDDALRNVTSDDLEHEDTRTPTEKASDALDGLLEELHYLDDQTEHADPIAVSPDAIREQITENNFLLDDVECRLPAIQHAKDNVQNLLEQQTSELTEEGTDHKDDFEDLQYKIESLDKLHSKICTQLAERSSKLNDALVVAEDFSQAYSDTIRSLRDVHDNLLSQDSPGVDPAVIIEQQKELNFIKDDLETIRPAIAVSKQHGDHLAGICGTPGNVEIQKYAEDMDQTLEDVQEGVNERDEELDTALAKSQRFDQILQTIMSWLPPSEQRLSSMSPVSTDPRDVRIQIEELKVLAIQVKPRGLVDVQNLQQYASDLKNASPITAESLTPQVEEVVSRWNTLLNNMQDRENQLKETLLTLGELDHAVDETLGFLQQMEESMQQMEDVYGDPKCLETHLKKIAMIQKDIKAQKYTIDKLNKTINDVSKACTNENGNRHSPLLEKQTEMNELYSAVELAAQDKQNQLHDVLKEVKAFMGEVEDNIRWFTEFRNQMKTSQPMGALPDTAQKQFERFMNEFREMDRKSEEVQALLLNGEDMIARCRDGDARQLSENLRKLHERVTDTMGKAARKKSKLNEHLSNVKDFHAMLKIHTEWLGNAEKILASFKHPSKLVDRVVQQIRDHSTFREDVEAHREIMMNLDRTGTYLKYFGRKQDTVYIKNLLISIKLRWKKLVRRVEEKGRLLEQAHKEDKRFYDAWSGLCSWLDEGERTLKKYGTGSPAKVKQDMDELKKFVQKSPEIKAFQHELSFKHPVFYSTMRLGRSLSDRCTKSDPEREVLQQMLDDLKNKWTILRSMISQRQNKLDEALLSSGRFTDALQSLLEWLTKAESYLSEDQPILGDLDTVHILVEQHKAFTQELDSRSNVVNAMQTSMSMSLNSDPDRDPDVMAAVEELTSAWDRVNQLSILRDRRLHESLALAEDFSDQVQVIREWLPTAESELKFRALPEDENQIINLIEGHDRFEDELRGQEPKIERIKYLADQILGSCHPNAVRFVKYYLTITQTRWEQALNRSAQRAQRLHDALRQLRGNAALSEELLAWLSEAQALLSTKEKDPIPEDLTVVEALVREHLEFHEDLSVKSHDVDRLTKTSTGREGKGRLGQNFGSNWKLNESDLPNSRSQALNSKWRNVWRISVDRKKKLQDILDHLLELESFKNFDFEMWRQRYISWVRAKKLRITDFFRRQDKHGEGYLTRKQFVEGMLTSKFPTNRTELNAVFEIFDRNHSGEIDYKEFIDALRPERSNRTRASKRQTDSELIHDEIEQQVAHCQCRRAFRVEKIADGKYKMGEKQKLCLVRFLNNTVMVRVGGGWVTLAAFLDQNDPCKAMRGRTTADLRGDSFMSEGSSTMRASFSNSPRRRASTPVHNGKMANGKASMNSSPSDGSLRRHLSGSTSSLASTQSSVCSASSSQFKVPRPVQRYTNNDHPSTNGTFTRKGRNSRLAASWSNLSAPSLTLTNSRQFGSMDKLDSPRRGSNSSLLSPTDSTPSTTPRIKNTRKASTPLTSTQRSSTPTRNLQRPPTPKGLRAQSPVGPRGTPNGTPNGTIRNMNSNGGHGDSNRSKSPAPPRSANRPPPAPRRQSTPRTGRT